LSATGDVGGFKHDNFAVSPPMMMTNPISGTGTGLDWAGQNPKLMVRTGNTRPFGATSADGGSSWTPFGTAVRSSLKAAISAEGGVIYLSNAQYSLDHGTTFVATATSGTGSLPSEGMSAIYADKVRPKVFYAFQAGTGNFYSTYKADGAQDGHTWILMNQAGPLPASSAGTVLPVYSVAGDIWLTQASAFVPFDRLRRHLDACECGGTAGLLTAVMTIAAGASASSARIPRSSCTGHTAAYRASSGPPIRALRGCGPATTHTITVARTIRRLSWPIRASSDGSTWARTGAGSSTAIWPGELARREGRFIDWRGYRRRELHIIDL